jgi:hypothetical protein
MRAARCNIGRARADPVRSIAFRGDFGQAPARRPAASLRARTQNRVADPLLTPKRRWTAASLARGSRRAHPSRLGTARANPQFLFARPLNDSTL